MEDLEKRQRLIPKIKFKVNYKYPKQAIILCNKNRSVLSIHFEIDDDK